MFYGIMLFTVIDIMRLKYNLRACVALDNLVSKPTSALGEFIELTGY